MELHLKIIGWILILLACSHALFPKYFNWTSELNALSLMNRQMMYIHTFFIALVVLLMGLLCLTASKAILETSLGHTIALGLCIFWASRLIIQFWGYSAKLWQGKQFETWIHIVFSCLWTYLSLVFFLIYRT